MTATTDSLLGRSYVMEKIEERLFGVCEGLLRQLEGDGAVGPETTLKER